MCLCYFPVSLPLPYRLPQDLSIAACWSLGSLLPPSLLFTILILLPILPMRNMKLERLSQAPNTGHTWQRVPSLPCMILGTLLCSVATGARTSGKQGVASALRRVVNYGTLSLSNLPSLIS